MTLPVALALSDRFEKALTKTFLTHTPELFASDFFLHLHCPFIIY